MPRTNLAKLAKENEAALRGRFEAMLAAHALPHKVRELYDACEPAWTVSINLKADRLDFFLQNGITYNRFRFDHASNKRVYLESPTAFESPVDWASYESEMGAWGPRRRVFNEFADREEEFTYGAYYLRGKGVYSVDFGRYMILLRMSWLREASETTFLRADSLQHYTTVPVKDAMPSQLDLPKLNADIANHGTVTALACLKKSEELEHRSVEDCIETICGPDEYLEAQIPNPIGFGEVDKVKMRALMEEELDIFADFITLDDVVKVEELDTQEKKNAYYYMLFSLEFPRKGVAVEEF